MDLMTFDLHARYSFKGRRPRPCGIAMHPVLFQQLAARMPRFDFRNGSPVTLKGVPVITLESIGESEIKVAMTPMAWMQLLAEKRREGSGSAKLLKCSEEDNDQEK